MRQWWSLGLIWPTSSSHPMKWRNDAFLICCGRYYSATILQMSGVRDDRLAIWLAGLTTLTNFLFTLLGVWLVERVGRRKLTLGSILGKDILAQRFHTKGNTKVDFCVLFFLFLFPSNRYVFEFESFGHRISHVCTAQPSGHVPPVRPRHHQLHLLQVPVSKHANNTTSSSIHIIKTVFLVLNQYELILNLRYLYLYLK